MNWWDGIRRQVTRWQRGLTGRPADLGRRDLVGGRKLEEWEQGWRRIGLLPSAHLTAPGETVGLFRLRRGEEVVFLGRSRGAKTDCLRQTLRGLVREGTATGTLLDQRLREWGHELVVEILITGCAESAQRLEQRWLQQLCPPWNRLELAPACTAPTTVASVRELNPG